jgi:imidazole glycerol-phosphate synthase subunit HisF
MLRSRIIPCLLLSDRGLVKTTQFGKPQYVGDPLNAVKIFNEKEVDELAFLDIDASAQDREPDFELVRRIAVECRMPLAYGGGVTTATQAARLIQLGTEKVLVSAAAIARPQLIREMADAIGTQSVSVVLDVRKEGLLSKSYRLYSHNGKRRAALDPLEFAERAQDLGAGEVVINVIDRDGMMQGYDLALAKAVRGRIDIPLTILGGAGSASDMQALIDVIGVCGAAAGALFVFKGKYRAVLINYARPARLTGAQP